MTDEPSDVEHLRALQASLADLRRVVDKAFPEEPPRPSPARLWYGLAVLLALLVVGIITVRSNACDRAGGVYVRGVWWFDCVPRR